MKKKVKKLEERLKKFDKHFGLIEESEFPLSDLRSKNLQKAFEFWLGEDYNNLTYQQVSYQLKKRGY